MSRQPRAWVRVDPRTKDKHPRERRYQVAYEDPTADNARRTRGGFRSKREADAWAADFTSRAREGRWVNPAAGADLFGDYAMTWLQTLHDLKPRTRESYRRIVNGEGSALRERFGRTRLADITTDAVQAWVNDLASERSATTVRNNFYVLRAVLTFAVEQRRIATNPALVVRRLPKVKPPKVQERERSRLSPADAERIAANLPAPYDTLTRLVAATGLRAGEAAGLTVADLDLDAGVLYIERALIDLDGRLTYDPPKREASRRAVALDPATTLMMRGYVAEHRQRAVRWLTAHPDAANPGEALPLFPGLETGRAYGRAELDRLDYSKPLRHSAWYGRHWKRALRMAGLPESVRFHDLRHAHVSWLVASGALSIKEISERVGHASAVMTLDRYTATPHDTLDRQRAALGAVLTRQANVRDLAGKRKKGAE